MRAHTHAHTHKRFLIVYQQQQPSLQLSVIFKDIIKPWGIKILNYTTGAPKEHPKLKF